jgi:hypothetical protein
MSFVVKKQFFFVFFVKTAFYEGPVDFHGSKNTKKEAKMRSSNMLPNRTPEWG